MLSSEDRLAIQDLYARYNAFFDLGDAGNWARCFTEDGEFAFHRVRGRPALADMCRQRFERRADETYMNAQHWNSNLIVEGDTDKARGICYVVRVARDRASGAFILLTPAMYQDELAKVDGQWLFVRRDATLDTPPSSFIPRKGA